VFSCDYNGWTDLPEAEREAIEAFEIGQEHPSAPVISREDRRPVSGSSREVSHRKAA
jgi:hypothetical protein